MSLPLLNEYQSRRIATHLQLLNDDLAALIRSPQLAQEGQPFELVRALIARVRVATGALRQALQLDEIHVADFRRRVAAVAEIWTARVEDLTTRRLTGYGTVHPQLAAQLDYRLAELASLLAQLADAAARLPSEES